MKHNHNVEMWNKTKAKQKTSILFGGLTSCFQLEFSSIYQIWYLWVLFGAVVLYILYAFYSMMYICTYTVTKYYQTKYYLTLVPFCLLIFYRIVNHWTEATFSCCGSGWRCQRWIDTFVVPLGVNLGCNKAITSNLTWKRLHIHIIPQQHPSPHPPFPFTTFPDSQYFSMCAGKSFSSREKSKYLTCG